MSDSFFPVGGVVDHVEKAVVDSDDDERGEEGDDEVAPPGLLVGVGVHVEEAEELQHLQ